MREQVEQSRCAGRFSIPVVAALMAILIGISMPASAFAESKIGVIDSQRIFSEYQQARDAEAVFQEEMRQWTQELEGLEKEIRELQERIRTQAMLLSKDRLDAMQSELDQKVQAYEARKKELFDPQDGQAVSRNQELSAPINEQITTVVERLGAEGGFELIFDLATVNVVYMADGIDLTDRVLEELAKGGSE